MSTNFPSTGIKPQDVAAELAQAIRDHRQRKTLRLVVRDNDGSNQCLPPSAWMILADRISNRAIDKVMDVVAKQRIGLAA
jgi:hypothetical protein